MTAAPPLSLPRWIAPLAIASVVGMVPWMIYLGLTLPERSPSDHYNIAWLGFDSALCLVLAALGIAAFRRSPWTGLLAAVTAAMLLVDGWFDITTSHGSGFVVAVVLAVCGELPLAAICALAAVHAERARSRQAAERAEAAVVAAALVSASTGRQ